MIKWDSQFILGIQTIDEQHRHLFEVGSELLELSDFISENDEARARFEVVLSQFKELTLQHFESEEGMLRRLGFPQVEAHHLKHMDFLRYLDTVETAVVERHSQSARDALKKQIMEWIAHHIQLTDHAYCDYFKMKGVSMD